MFLVSVSLKALIDSYLIVKTLHIISSTVLFGTGLGIAFFMLRSFFTTDIKEKYYAVRGTVIADFFFTFPATIIQPVTGAWLVWHSGYDWTNRWIVWTIGLYLLAACCWLPVVWIQIELKRMLSQSLETGEELPARYHSLFRIWFILGWPAFFALVLIFLLMVVKPI